MGELSLGELFANGRMIDCILILMSIEALALVIFSRKSRVRIAPSEIIMNLGAGAALLAALRAAILQQGWPVIALWLGVALAAHIFELSLRWATPG